MRARAVWIRKKLITKEGNTAGYDPNRHWTSWRDEVIVVTYLKVWKSGNLESDRPEALRFHERLLMYDLAQSIISLAWLKTVRWIELQMQVNGPVDHNHPLRTGQSLCDFYWLKTNSTSSGF